MIRFASIVWVCVLIALAVSSPAVAGWDEGVAAFKKNDFKAAITEFSALVKQSPDSTQGHYMLGLSYGAAGDKTKALRHLRKADDLNRAHPSALFAGVNLEGVIEKLSGLSGRELRKASVELGVKLGITAGPVGGTS